MPAWTSKGFGQVQAAEGHVLGIPDRWAYSQEKRGVIVLRGASGDHMASFGDVLGYAKAGFPAIACDFGSTSGVLWGNDTALARIDAAWAYLKSQLNAKPDKVGLAAGSGGCINAFNWAKRNLGSVAAIAGVIPGISLVDIHDNNRNSLAANVEAAYGGAAGYAAAVAARDPNAWAASLAGPPIKLWYSSDDPVAIPSFVGPFATATQAQTVNMGPLGHASDPTRGEELNRFLSNAL